MIANQLVTTELQDGVTVLSFRPKGVSLTESVMAQVSAAFTAAADSNPGKVVVDLDQVEFFSSSFIEVLFRLWRQLKKHEQGDFALAGLNTYCQEILDVTNLSSVWSIYPTRRDAITALLASGTHS